MENIGANHGRVSLVGAGPGSPDLITLRGWGRLQQAEVLVYDALVHPDLVSAAPAGAIRIPVGKRGYCIGSTRQETIHEVLLHHAKLGRRVVRLKGGDPCLFGRGGEEAECLAAEGIPFEIIPGITTALAAGASTGIPLTHRDCGQSLTFITGHHDPDSPECTHDWECLARMTTLVVYMGLRHIAKIADRLVNAGLDATTPVAIISHATLATQQVIEMPVGELGSDPELAEIPAPAIVIIGASVRYRHQLDSVLQQSLALPGTVS